MQRACSEVLLMRIASFIQHLAPLSLASDCPARQAQLTEHGAGWQGAPQRPITQFRAPSHVLMIGTVPPLRKHHTFVCGGVGASGSHCQAVPVNNTRPGSCMGVAQQNCRSAPPPPLPLLLMLPLTLLLSAAMHWHIGKDAVPACPSENNTSQGAVVTRA